jgi:hypothetical protein
VIKGWYIRVLSVDLLLVFDSLPNDHDPTGSWSDPNQMLDAPADAVAWPTPEIGDFPAHMDAQVPEYEALGARTFRLNAKEPGQLRRDGAGFANGYAVPYRTITLRYRIKRFEIRGSTFGSATMVRIKRAFCHLIDAPFVIDLRECLGGAWSLLRYYYRSSQPPWRRADK